MYIVLGEYKRHRRAAESSAELFFRSSCLDQDRRQVYFHVRRQRDDEDESKREEERKEEAGTNAICSSFFLLRLPDPKYLGLEMSMSNFWTFPKKFGCSSSISIFSDQFHDVELCYYFFKGANRKWHFLVASSTMNAVLIAFLPSKRYIFLPRGFRHHPRLHRTETNRSDSRPSDPFQHRCSLRALLKLEGH